MKLVSATVVSLVLCGLFIWVVPEVSPSRKPGASPHFDLSRDPKEGTALSLALPEVRDALGRPIPETSSVIVVNGGACSGCSLKSVEFSKLPLADFDCLIVFYQATEEEIAKEMSGKGVPKNVFLLSDESARAESTLNALWVGRWYVFQDKKLIRTQSSPNAVNWRI